MQYYDYLLHLLEIDYCLDEFIKVYMIYYLTVNCIYWEKRFPRLLSTKQLQDLKRKGCPLVGISDITCDIGGSLEFLNQTTTIDSPFFRQIPHQKLQLLLLLFSFWRSKWGLKDCIRISQKVQLCFSGTIHLTILTIMIWTVMA